MANYRVHFDPNIDDGSGEEFVVDCPMIEVAKIVEDALANYTLFLQERGLMKDCSNYGMILKEDADGEWCEVDDWDEG